MTEGIKAKPAEKQRLTLSLVPAFQVTITETGRENSVIMN